MTGLFSLLTLLGAIFAQGFVSEKLIVAGDATTTAANILAHRGLYQAGFSVYLLEMAAQVAMTALFYELLRPCGKSLSLVAAYLMLVGCAIKTMSRVFFIVPLFFVGDAHDGNATALLLLRINSIGAGTALVFFGFSGIAKGWLMLRATFLPRVFGVLSLVGGLGWLTFLSPTVGVRFIAYVGGFGMLAALALIVWLLIFGVNETRWKEQARAS
jgi:hypothetical protein